MTERLPASVVALQLTALAALHVRMAAVITELATLSDARNFQLRRDMQHNYTTAIGEAEQLFDQVKRDLEELRTQLPPELGKTIDTIEDELTHIKHMLAGPDESDAEGTSDGSV